MPSSPLTYDIVTTSMPILLLESTKPKRSANVLRSTKGT